MQETRRWLFTSCALLGFSNLFSQTVVPATTLPSMNASATAGASLPAVGGAIKIAPTAPGVAIPSDARITNLSTRAHVAKDSPLITGFAISGSTTRTMLMRAVGPTLGVFGLTGTLAAPRLKLYDATGEVVLENAGWGGASALVTAMAVAGAFPLPAGSADSAAVATLAPGIYTVEVSDDAGRGGVVLTEIYDVNGTAAGSHLVNVSTRNTVAADGGEFISGFTVSGTRPQQFLVRGVGPGLTKFGVTGVLSDPEITIFDSAGQQIVNNDDWNGPTKPDAGVFYVGVAVAQGASVASGATVAVTTTPDPVTAASQATGAFALETKSFDAALVTTLAPGGYTVQVSGNSLRVVTPIPPAAVPTGAVQAAVPTGAAVAVSLVPALPGVALLEIYAVP